MIDYCCLSTEDKPFLISQQRDQPTGDYAGPAVEFAETVAVMERWWGLWMVKHTAHWSQADEQEWKVDS